MTLVVTRMTLRSNHRQREKTTHLEQPECLALVLFVERKAVINARGEHKEVSGLNRDADPSVRRGFWRFECYRAVCVGVKNRNLNPTSDVEKSTSTDDLSDFLVLVHVPASRRL